MTSADQFVKTSNGKTVRVDVKTIHPIRKAMNDIQRDNEIIARQHLGLPIGQQPFVRRKTPEELILASRINDQARFGMTTNPKKVRRMIRKEMRVMAQQLSQK